MVKKALFAVLALFGLVILLGTRICFADALGQLEKVETYKWYPAQAEAIYQEITRDYPGSDYALTAHKNLIVSYLSAKRDGDAQQTLEKLTADFSGQPGLPAALYDIARIYERTKKYEKATGIYQQIIQQYPDSSSTDKAQLAGPRIAVLSHIELKDEIAAAAATGSLIAEFNGHSELPGSLYDIARRYERAKKYDKAKGLYQQIIQQYAESSAAGKAQLAVKRTDVMLLIKSAEPNAVDEAIEDLIADFASHPALSETLFDIAEKGYEKLRTPVGYERAKRIYQQVIQRYPDSSHAARARLLVPKMDILSSIRNNEYEQASILTEKLIADFAGHSYLASCINVIVNKIGEKYYAKAFRFETEGREDEAKEYYRRAVAIWEKVITQLPASAAYTPQACHRVAYCCFEHTGEYEKAIGLCQNIVINWPDYKYVGDVQFLIGNYYERLQYAGLIPEPEADIIIEQAYQTVVNKYPDCDKFEYALLKLAELNFEKGQWSKAAVYYELFLTTFPDVERPGRILYPLGQAYDNMGEVGEALRVYNEFLQKAHTGDPRVESIRRRIEQLTDSDAKTTKNILSDILLSTVYGGCLCAPSLGSDCAVGGNGGICTYPICSWEGGCDCEEAGRKCYFDPVMPDNCVDTTRSCNGGCYASYCYVYGSQCKYWTRWRSCNLDTKPHCYYDE